MCDFKVGDQVVCVDDSSQIPFGMIMPNGMVSSGSTGLVRGQVYRVRRIGVTMSGSPGVDVGEGPTVGRHAGFSLARRFRKVQRNRQDLSIERFLTIKPGFEEPKRAPEKQKEKAQ